MPKKTFKTTPRANKKTPALVRGVLKGISEGHTQGEACALADVSAKAWQNWVREDSARPERPIDWKSGDTEPDGGWREGLADLEAEARDLANAVRLQTHHVHALGLVEGVETVTFSETRLRKAVHTDQFSGQLFEAEEPYEHTETRTKRVAKADLRALEWEMERSDRTNYSPPQKIELTGEDGGAVQLAIGFDAQLAKLYGDVLAKEALADVAGGAA